MASILSSSILSGLVASPVDFSSKEFRDILKTMLPTKMQSLGIPVNAETIAAITIESSPHPQGWGTRYEVSCQGKVLLTHAEVEKIHRQCVRDDAKWEEFQGAPLSSLLKQVNKESDTPLLDKLLGKDSESDPFEAHYEDAPKPKVTGPKHAPKEPPPPPPVVVTDTTEIKLTVKKAKRRLG